jgi:hypothetical protein
MSNLELRLIWNKTSFYMFNLSRLEEQWNELWFIALEIDLACETNV